MKRFFFHEEQRRMRSALKLFIVGIALTAGIAPATARTIAKSGRHSLFSLFANPPAGYGNVPFYWWNGDSLKLERLEWELDQLADASTTGLSISYIHTHPTVDKEANAMGYGSFGRADEGSPKVFSDAWWSVFNDFAELCADRGIGVGIDDYVLGWNGNGYYVDEIMAEPSFSDYPGRLSLDSVRDSKGNWKYEVRISPSPELHPDYGKRIVETYFQRCYDRLTPKARTALNYFFQDELSYDLRLDSWAEDMPEQFIKRKGYDIVPHLPALFRDNEEDAAKIRMDYADVLVQLAEERYFRPILNWHAEKGLIYGCDNIGRGLDPTSYLDYFRITSNFTAPGNDAPARGSSFVQSKVSSSIAHLYDRPRTWLEAFHSMGWNANGNTLTRQLDHHLLAGGNLLCMHGLYYSTHGGWWEWAPPCFHFRMPYWPHMKHWLRYAERMCYILSQGHHVCDVAVLYPTETLQAYRNADRNLFRKVAERLSSQGMDYDFVDTRSLNSAKVGKGWFSIGQETYKVLVLPGIKILPEATRRKIAEFKKKGGMVIELSADDPQLASAIRSAVGSDFLPLSHPARVLHRRVGRQDVFMIENTPGQENIAEFRTSGIPELWNAFEATRSELPILSFENGVTRMRIPASNASSSLIVFSPGTPKIEKDITETQTYTDSLHLNGNWTVRYIPTMDNRYGDFRLPATDEIIGVEAREIEVTAPDGTYYGNQTWGFGPMMETATVHTSMLLEDIMNSLDSLEYAPYCFSWQYGVFDHPGSQGYHGLKGKVDDQFIILDKGGHQVFRTFAKVPDNGLYRIDILGTVPDIMLIGEEKVNIKNLIDNGYLIHLEKGWQRMVLVYGNTPKARFKMEEHSSNDIDPRQRSAVVIYPSDQPQPTPRSAYGDIVAMKWYSTPHLAYNAMPSSAPWTYVFELAPGSTGYDLDIAGKVVSETREGNKVTLKALPEAECPGAAIFRQPVKIHVGEGSMPLGDWTKVGPLKHYSGGIAYATDFDASDLGGVKKVELLVGEVDATAEVVLNGELVAIKLESPFKADLTNKIKPGRNHLEIIVYSSLSNHYQTTPSPYRHNPHAGLIGPVTIHSM